MASTPGKSRTSKEKEALEVAERVNAGWEEAKAVPSDSHPPTAAELDAILSSADSSMDASKVGPEGEASPPREGAVKGRAAEFYSSEQALHNMMLRAAVNENEELLSTLHELQGEQVANARQLLADRNFTRAERVREFDNGFRHADSLGQSVAQIIREEALRVGLDRLAELGTVRAPSINPVITAQEEALQQGVGSQRRHEIEEECPALLREFFQLGPHATDLVTCMLRFHDLVHTDVFRFTKEELAKSADAINTLVTQVEEKEQQHTQFMQSDDVVKARECRMQALSMLERLCQLTRARIDAIASGSGDGGAFRSNVDRARDMMAAAVRDANGPKQQLRIDILADLDSLAARGQKEVDQDSHSIVEYDQYIKQSNEKLNMLAKQQDTIWEKVHDMVSEVKALGDERYAEVQRHLERTEQEQRRRREYAEFSEHFSSHCVRLEEALKNTETACKLADSFNSFLERATQKAGEMTFEEELREIRIVELKRYLEFHRKYVLTSADMMLRRKARLRGLQRLLRNTEASMELVPDTLDPNRTMYKEQLDQLGAQVHECEESLGELQRRHDEQKELFQPISDMLDDHDVDFVPPQMEKEELEVEHRERIIGVQKRIARAEQDEVETEQTQIRKVAQTTRAAKEDLTKRRQNKKQATQRKSAAAGILPADAQSD
eukprot:TRINITY_DN70118_c0_g1_i1.p1 TRINITY_DN70118_c0_g1~~TRINITY_DN70118_c0_g1_i1.p1  ORF type:complete len:707 (+),score=308.16 TRINITY_DN70118_c0_g1_i1:119-2122(+)